MQTLYVLREEDVVCEMSLVRYEKPAAVEDPDRLREEAVWVVCAEMLQRYCCRRER